MYTYVGKCSPFVYVFFIKQITRSVWDRSQAPFLKQLGVFFAYRAKV